MARHPVRDSAAGGVRGGGPGDEDRAGGPCPRTRVRRPRRRRSGGKPAPGGGGRSRRRSKLPGSVTRSRPMTVRDATEADLPAIVAIYNAAIPGRTATADLEPVTVE